MAERLKYRRTKPRRKHKNSDGSHLKEYQDQRRMRQRNLSGFGKFVSTVRQALRMGKDDDYRQMRQEDLAKLSGLSPSYITMIEHYNTIPSHKCLKQLAAALRVDEDQIMLRAGRPTLASQIAMSRYPTLFLAFIKIFHESAAFRAELGILMDRIGASSAEDRRGEIVARVKFIKNYAEHMPYRQDSARQAKLHEVLKVLMAYIQSDVWTHTPEYLRQAEYWKSQAEAELNAEKALIAQGVIKQP